MKSPTLVFYLLIAALSIGVSVYSEQHGYMKGMIDATKTLEPHLCK